MMNLKSLVMGVAITAMSVALMTGCARDRHASVDHDDTYGMVVAADSVIGMAEASNLIGMDIKGSDNETLGVLDDIVVRRNDGKIAYGVIAHGGFLGIRERFHAVAWDAFELRRVDGKNVLYADLTEESLKNAQPFDKSNYPLSPTIRSSGSTVSMHSESLDIRNDASIWSDSDVDRSRDDAVSQRLGGEENSYGYVGDDASRRDDMASDKELPAAFVANGELVRLAKFIGWDFHHTEGNIGEVEQAVIDMKLGHLAYLVISFDGTVDELDDRVALIPWSALTLLPSETAVSLRNTVDASGLVAMSFERDSVPDINDRSATGRVYSQYNVEPYWEAYGYTGDDDFSRDVRNGAHNLKEDVKKGARELEGETREFGRDVRDQF